MCVAKTLCSFWDLISLVLWVYQWSPFCYPWPAFGGTQIQLSGQVTRFLPKSSKFSNPVPPTKWVFSFNSLLVSQTNTSPCSLNQMLLITALTLNPHFLQLLEISTAANIFFLDTHKNSRSRQNGKHLSMAETQTTDWNHTLVYALMPPASSFYQDHDIENV